MGKLSIKVSSKFMFTKARQDLKQAMKDGAKNAQQEAADTLIEKIKENIEVSFYAANNDIGRLPAAFWTEDEYFNPDDRRDSPKHTALNLLGTQDDNEGNTRVGFYGDNDPEGLDIIYSHEFGGFIFVTQTMRDWWKGRIYHANKDLKWDDPRRVGELQVSSINVTEKRFFRDAIEEFGSEGALRNQMRLAFKSQFQTSNEKQIYDAYHADY